MKDKSFKEIKSCMRKLKWRIRIGKILKKIDSNVFGISNQILIDRCYEDVQVILAKLDSMKILEKT